MSKIIAVISSLSDLSSLSHEQKDELIVSPAGRMPARRMCAPGRSVGSARPATRLAAARLVQAVGRGSSAAVELARRI